jgi:HSP20 family molecular chaperone IbpA
MTSAIRWEPIEDIKAIRDMVGQTVGWLCGRVPLPCPLGARSARLAVDLYQTEVAYVAVADMPGVGGDDVDVSVSGSRLTIAGKRKPSDPEVAFVRHERLGQRFSRSLRLPGDVDVGGITAKLASGVLTVTLPKGGVGEEI